MSKHNERCKECKKAFLLLLEKSYGEIKANFNLELPSRIDDLRNIDSYGSLLSIHEALKSYRGHEVFVRSKKLPNVDYFLVAQKIIVEFDESQHFTAPRKISLENYADLKPGFSTIRWAGLCSKLNKCDNDPPYRDEQRAWYDTLRDFAGTISNKVNKTVRVYASDEIWCKLDSESLDDINKFKSHIGL